jgi:elongation factor Ts
MAISPADVKTLREKTGAGMMDCKKALEESNGDFPKAEKILKEKGLAAADKRQGRVTKEGKIFASVKGNKAVILELSCETDFVARNKEFNTLGSRLMDTIIDKKLAAKTDELTGMVKDTIGIIKENMDLKRFSLIDLKDNEFPTVYIHGEGKLGVIVILSLANAAVKDNPKLKEAAFDLALHITAFAPLYVSKDKVDAGFIKEQEEIFHKQAIMTGKPEKVIEGITKGKVAKYLQEICLLDQGFVKDEKITVAQLLANLGKELGTKVEVSNFLYYKVGVDSLN